MTSITSQNAKKDYNMAMLHKRKDNTEESWTQTGNPDKMRELFTGFEPRYGSCPFRPAAYTYFLSDCRGIGSKNSWRL